MTRARRKHRHCRQCVWHQPLLSRNQSLLSSIFSWSMKMQKKYRKREKHRTNCMRREQQQGPKTSRLFCFSESPLLRLFVYAAVFAVKATIVRPMCLLSGTRKGIEWGGTWIPGLAPEHERIRTLVCFMSEIHLTLPCATSRPEIKALTSHTIRYVFFLLN